MSWLSDIWDAITSLFTPSPPAQPVAPCAAASGVSPQRAQQIFDQMRARTDIPFNYPVDCCYARASEMCDAMQQAGVPSRKVWSYGDLHPTNPDGSPVRFPPGTGQPVEWGYHVAPVIDVAQPDGSTVPMVMDPSLSDRPLTVDQWNAIMTRNGGSISRTDISDRSPFYREPDGTPHYEDASWNRNLAFASHRAARDQALGHPGAPP